MIAHDIPDRRPLRTLVDARPAGNDITFAGLDRLAGDVDGISVDKAILLRDGGAELVQAAHARGLDVFTWTCRPENAFLDRRFRRGARKAAFGDYRAEWEAIAATGVDGVFVDHPDLGAAVLRR